MNRREFIAMLAGAAAAPALAAHAQQQPAMPVIGFLNPTSPGPYAPFVAAFLQGLNETGYVEGRNVAIEYRWAEGRYDRLPALAAELARIPVAVIVATGGESGAAAAKEASQTIPIVFTSGGDPVKAGLVVSLNRPGGHLTGVNLVTSDLAAKRLELLTELLPGATTVAMLVNPDSATAESNAKAAEEAARVRGLHVHILKARREGEFDAAFAAVVALRAAALVVDANAFFNSRREQLVALAARHGIPAVYERREFAEAGGLISYGTSLQEGYRQIGLYVGKILNGAKPSDLPVVQLSKVELVINVKTAKALGLTVPASILARADEVIE